MPWLALASIPVAHPNLRSPGSRKIGFLCLVVCLVLCGSGRTAEAQSKADTNTTLSIASGGVPVTTVASGGIVTLTATVSAGATALTVGQVFFCDASVSTCTDIHRIGQAQLTKAGTAEFKFRPGPGNHSYRAMFRGTVAYLASSSATQGLSVTGPIPSTTILTETNFTSYDLTATVYGTGSAPPGGTVSFLDLTNNNSILGSATLTGGATGLSFVRLPNFPATGQQPHAISMGDFNGDGIEDLAIANSGAVTTVATGPTVTILLGNGDGNFSSVPTSSATGASPEAIAVGDFNQDGVLDLAVANFGDNNLSILLGNGDGTFTASPSSPAVGIGPVSLAAADFNGDGILDLAVVNQGSNDLILLVGNGDGTFARAPTNQQTGSAPYLVATADFNGDGVPDLAVLNNNNGQNTLTIFLGSGTGGFNLVSTGPGTGNIADVLAIGDFNGDGRPDLALAHSVISGALPNQVATVTVSILTGNGDGTFKAGSQLIFTSPNGGAADAAFVSDFNGDGKPDLAIQSQSQLAGHIPEMITVLPGDGTGIFSNPGITASLGYSPSPLALGDLNGDGIPDVAAVASNALGAGNLPASVYILLAEDQSASATANGVVVPVATGNNLVVASYAGDSNYQPSVSSSVTLLAGKGNPVVSVTPSSNPAAYGASEMLTAKVTGTGLPPTGTVTFYDGAGQLSAISLSSGAATYVTAAFTVGTHVISVAYSGDSNYNSGTSPSSNLVVQKGPPTETVTPASTRIPASQSSLSVSVMVTGAAGNPTPSGTVTLLAGASNLVSGGQSFGPITLVNQGATFTVPGTAFSAGQNTVTATYAPDTASAGLYTSVTQSAGVFVTGTAVPGITLTPSATAITDQQSVNVVVSITGPSGGLPPSGSVTLAAGSYSAQMALNGAVTFTIPAGALSLGSETLTATYSGDQVYAGASGTTTVTVSPFLVSVTTPAAVAAGSNTTSVWTLTAGSYSGSMSLACSLSSSPSNAQFPPTCALNPAKVTIASGGNATTTVTFKTTGSSTTLLRPFRDHPWRLGEGGLTLACLLMWLGKRRYGLRLLFVSVVLLCIVAIAGCGGSRSTTHSVSGTSPGNYVFTVTATDAANAKITSSVNIPLVVQ